MLAEEAFPDHGAEGHMPAPTEDQAVLGRVVAWQEGLTFSRSSTALSVLSLHVRRKARISG